MNYYKVSIEFTFESKKQLTQEQTTDIVHNQIEGFIDSFLENNNVKESERHDCCWGLTKEDE